MIGSELAQTGTSNFCEACPGPLNGVRLLTPSSYVYWPCSDKRRGSASPRNCEFHFLFACFFVCLFVFKLNTILRDQVIPWRSATHLYVFRFLTPALTQLSFQSHGLLFRHASEERGERSPEESFPQQGLEPTPYRTT